jgi:hypothetical protein
MGKTARGAGAGLMEAFVGQFATARLKQIIRDGDTAPTRSL